MNDAFDRVFDLVPVALFVFVLLGLFVAVAEGIQSYRSTPSEIACRLKQMDSMRRALHSSAVCVPYHLRRDTISVEGHSNG